MLLKKLSESNESIELLSECLREEINAKNFVVEKAKDLRQQLSQLTSTYEETSEKLKISLNKLELFDKKNIKNMEKKIERRDKRTEEVATKNNLLVSELQEVLLLKESFSNQNEELQTQFERVSSLLDKFLKAKTQNQKMKWYYKNLVEKLNKNNNALDTSFEARISELHNQIKILEVQKTEVEDRLQSFLDTLIERCLKMQKTADSANFCTFKHFFYLFYLQYLKNNSSKHSKPYHFWKQY